MSRLVALNEKRRKIGEFNHRAKISDHDVDLIRDLREKYRLTYKQIAEKYEGAVSWWMIGRICRYERRAERAEYWVRVND